MTSTRPAPPDGAVPGDPGRDPSGAVVLACSTCWATNDPHARRPPMAPANATPPPNVRNPRRDNPDPAPADESARGPGASGSLLLRSSIDSSPALMRSPG